MSFILRKTLAFDFDEAVRRTGAAIAEEGLAPGEDIDLSRRLGASGELAVKRCRILGASACNFVLTEMRDEPGRIEIMAIDAEAPGTDPVLYRRIRKIVARL